MADSLPHAPPRQPQGDPTQPDPPSPRQLPGPLDKNSHDQAPHASTFSDFHHDGVSTASDASDDTRNCKIDLPSRAGVVVWDDVDHRLQHTSELKMDLHVDTSEQRALFTLRGHFFLKAGTPSNIQLFLIIYPEVIRSIGLEASTNPPLSALKDNRFVSLRFIMTQPPRFVGPRGRPLEPKERSQDLLSAMTALSLVSTFTIYLDMLSMPEARDQLGLLPLIFSSTDIRNRPRTDEIRAGLQRLYGGAGGQIINSDLTGAVSNDGPSNATKGARVPDGKFETNASPAYFSHFDRKRRHSGDPLPCYVDQEGINEIGPSVDLVRASKTPARPPTPSDRKRQRTSEPQSPKAFQDLVLAFRNLEERQRALEETPFLQILQDVARGFRKMVDQNERLVHRIKELEDRHTATLERVIHEAERTTKLETRIKELNARLDNQTDCRYDSDEEGNLLRRIDKSVARAFEAACDDLRGWNTNEGEMEMAYRLEVQREKMEGEWIEQARDEFLEQVTDNVKEQIAKEVAERATTSLRVVHSRSNPPVPIETSLFITVQDIQATYCPWVMDVDSYELVWVMEYLRDNPMSAVMYHASGSATRREFVKKWKAEAEDCRQRPRE